MKTLLVICLMLAAPWVWADKNAVPLPSPAAVVKGEVLEVRDVETYTYLRLKTRDGETWAAVAKAAVSKGAKVTIENAVVMNNFHSKSLDKTFSTIVFGSLSGAPAATQAAASDMAAAHAGLAKPVATADIHVAKASGANARTVAEITAKDADLKDKPVLVSGKVVKYNPGIMGKNWIHLRDGTGSAADNTDDILVTSTDAVKLGDVVTMKGVVRTDRDFGAGYAYKVLVEDASLQR